MYPFHYITLFSVHQIWEDGSVEIVGEAHDARSCIPVIENAKPDALLLDIQMMTPTDGIDIIPELKFRFPDLTIIMLTVSSIDIDIFNALSNGADNYILKDISNPDIIKKVIEICNGDLTINKEILDKYIRHTKAMSNDYQSLLFFTTIVSTLTKSEIQVLHDLCENKSYAEIAKARFTAEGTVRTIVSHIVKKFHVNNINVLIAQIKEFDLFHKFNSFLS